MAARKEPVLQFGERPEPGPLRRLLDVLTAVFGKVVSVLDVALLLSTGGYTVTNAATGAGTAITVTRTTLDFQDAGIDSVRVVVRGENSTAGEVTVQVYNTTTSAAMCTATITGTSEQSDEGDWAVFTPNGGDEEFEVRVVGDGAMDPILYAVHLQARTTQARS